MCVCVCVAHRRRAQIRTMMGSAGIEVCCDFWLRVVPESAKEPPHTEARIAFEFVRDDATLLKLISDRLSEVGHVLAALFNSPSAPQLTAAKPKLRSRAAEAKKRESAREASRTLLLERAAAAQAQQQWHDGKVVGGCCLQARDLSTKPKHTKRRTSCRRRRLLRRSNTSTWGSPRTVATRPRPCRTTRRAAVPCTRCIHVRAAPLCWVPPLTMTTTTLTAPPATQHESAVRARSGSGAMPSAGSSTPGTPRTPRTPPSPSPGLEGAAALRAGSGSWAGLATAPSSDFVSTETKEQQRRLLNARWTNLNLNWQITNEKAQR